MQINGILIDSAWQLLEFWSSFQLSVIGYTLKNFAELTIKFVHGHFNWILRSTIRLTK